MCTFSAVINVWSSFEICIKMHRQIKCVFECLKCSIGETICILG